MSMDAIRNWQLADSLRMDWKPMIKVYFRYLFFLQNDCIKIWRAPVAKHFSQTEALLWHFIPTYVVASGRLPALLLKLIQIARNLEKNCRISPSKSVRVLVSRWHGGCHKWRQRKWKNCLPDPSYPWCPKQAP